MECRCAIASRDEVVATVAIDVTRCAEHTGKNEIGFSAEKRPRRQVLGGQIEAMCEQNVASTIPVDVAEFSDVQRRTPVCISAPSGFGRQPVGPAEKDNVFIVM